MTTASQIRKLAEEYAEQARQRTARLEREVSDLEAGTAKKRAELTAAKLADERLARFAVQVGADYQCPRCGIERERRAALRPVGGGTGTEEIFRCRECGSEFSISF